MVASILLHALLSWIGPSSANLCDHVVARAEWGAMPTNWSEPFPSLPLNQVFIHHTAGSECHTKESCESVVRSIQRFHAIDRDWGDIGYNFLIGGDGRVYEGRGWSQVGAQVYGFNRVSVGIALLGNFMKVTPSDTMTTLAQKLIACGKNLHYLTPDAKIHGHRDGGCTECPGDQLQNIIKTWPDFVPGPLPGSKCWIPPKKSNETTS